MMPYVDRNPDGNIVGVYINQQREGQEFVESAELWKPITVPVSVTMRQARLALLQAAKLTLVTQAIQQMQGIEGEQARIEWEYSNEVRRNQPLTIALAQAIGMTEGEMDNLFIEASKL